MTMKMSDHQAAHTHESARRDLDAEHDGGTQLVVAVVVALLPEYHQVRVQDDAGRLYAITRKTAGIALDTLSEGQRVACTVTHRLPRVLSAVVLAQN